MKGGEYIAIESMEKEYSTSVFVNGINGGVMCYGDGDMDRPVAVVQANCIEIRKALDAKKGPKFQDDDDLCASKEANEVVLENLRAVGKSGGLGGNEIIEGVHLIRYTPPPSFASLELFGPGNVSLSSRH